MTAEADRGFLSRWSQRKAQVRQGALVPPEAPPAAAAPPEPPPAPAAPAAATAPVPLASGAAPTTPAEPPPLTLDDVATLTRESDYAPFVAREVQPEVRNAALKKLFTDPQFNVMDGLDTYIDDYNKLDPLPPGMLRQMVQSQLLGLFADEPEPDKEQAAASTQRQPPRDEDADLQLQPDDAAGAVEPAPAQPGVGEDGAARGPGQH